MVEKVACCFLPQRPQLAGVYRSYYFPRVIVGFGILHNRKPILMSSTKSMLIVLIKHELFEISGDQYTTGHLSINKVNVTFR